MMFTIDNLLKFNEILPSGINNCSGYSPYFSSHAFRNPPNKKSLQGKGVHPWRLITET
jgi:hypothetical protein